MSEVVADETLPARAAELAGMYAQAPTRAIGMTKRLFDHADNATLDAQLELERGSGGRDADGRLPRGRDRLPREAPSAVLRRVVRIQTVDYHTAGEPFRIVTGGPTRFSRQHDPRQAPPRA